MYICNMVHYIQSMFGSASTMCISSLGYGSFSYISFRIVTRMKIGYAICFPSPIIRAYSFVNRDRGEVKMNAMDMCVKCSKTHRHPPFICYALHELYEPYSSRTQYWQIGRMPHRADLYF